MNVTRKPGWSHTLLYDTVYDNLNKMFLTELDAARDGPSAHGKLISDNLLARAFNAHPRPHTLRKNSRRESPVNARGAASG